MAIKHSLLALASLISIGQCLPFSVASSTPTIPLDEDSNTGPSPLPSPASTLKLKYIGVHLGTQNYTCNSTTGTYFSPGALAQIFDATEYLTAHPNEIDSISQTYLDHYTALPCSESSSDCIESDDRCEDQANARTDHPLPVLGEHYFTSSGTPTFDLYNGRGHPFLYGKKLGDIPAPSSSDVDWLYLVSNGSAANHIISTVYRIETAGGVQPDSCTGSGSITVPYAGQYWYYG